jgi:hypothetical protein
MPARQVDGIGRRKRSAVRRALPCLTTAFTLKAARRTSDDGPAVSAASLPARHHVGRLGRAEDPRVTHEQALGRSQLARSLVEGSAWSPRSMRSRAFRRYTVASAAPARRRPPAPAEPPTSSCTAGGTPDCRFGARVLLGIGTRRSHMTRSTTRNQIRWTNIRGQVTVVAVWSPPTGCVAAGGSSSPSVSVGLTTVRPLRPAAVSRRLLGPLRTSGITGLSG